MQNFRPISILVSHSDSIIATGLMTVLASRPDLLVLNDPAASASQPDVLVTDYQTGIATAQRMRERGQVRPRVLVVTYKEKEWDIKQAVDNGVHGYMMVSCAPDELALAVRELHQGRRYLGEHIAARVASCPRRELLTQRENQVLQLLATGSCNKSIARTLGIGLGTVKTHVKGVLSKLDATARTHAVIVATQRGMVDVGRSDQSP